MYKHKSHHLSLRQVIDCGVEECQENKVLSEDCLTINVQRLQAIFISSTGDHFRFSTFNEIDERLKINNNKPQKTNNRHTV
jgi:hypothetical protein